MRYLTTIGLEIHVQVGTRSKMFCRCSAAVFGEAPNTHTCPVCLGLPGALPVPNSEAIKLALLAGEALGSTHPEVSRFDRKNYFYPDLPKGYQISQLDFPLNIGGQVKVGERIIHITRAHLEEDTGRLQHAENKTLVDYNRSSLPLLEIVSEPVIDSAEEAKAYAQKVQQLMRYAGVSEADMEKGSLRVDANVSVRSEEQQELNPKVEIKNMNSFRAVERALLFEIDRQTRSLEAGGKAIQETRGWNESKGLTYSQRAKEDSHDYRYFPEPDLPPIKLTKETLEEIKKLLPELPEAKLVRYQKEFGLKKDLAETLTADRVIAELFEKSAEEITDLKVSEGDVRANGKITRLGNIIRREVLSLVNEGVSLEKLEPAMIAELTWLLEENKVPASAASVIVREMTRRGVMPAKLVEEKGLAIDTNEENLAKLAQDVLEENARAVGEYKLGKAQVMGFLIGQLMKKSGGRASSTLAHKVISEALTRQLQ
jgi:aspartyl-tRNA(Asn)/glutamyl-tRNA(Gln) amidotransferase subunit B